MNIAKEFYKILEKECGDMHNIKGTNTTTLRNMKEGKVKGMNTKTIEKIFKANGMTCEFVVGIPSGENKRVPL